MVHSAENICRHEFHESVKIILEVKINVYTFVAYAKREKKAADIQNKRLYLR